MSNRIYQSVRLNWSNTGWGVVDKSTGALVRLNGGLAMRLTENDADTLAAKRNSASLKRAAAKPRPVVTVESERRRRPAASARQIKAAARGL